MEYIYHNNLMFPKKALEHFFLLFWAIDEFNMGFKNNNLATFNKIT